MYRIINGTPMEFRTEISSIFDHNIAGQMDDNGNYMCIHIDHKTHNTYCVTKETEFSFDTKGKPLCAGEISVFNGEEVRGMTEREEELWNQDRLVALVDCWGNISTSENKNAEYCVWYMENCI